MFTIVPAAAGDIPALAHIQIEGWRAAYAGQADQAYLDSLDQAEKEGEWQRWLNDESMRTLVARDGNDKVAGFISFGKLKTPPPGGSMIRPPYSAEIYALYILPDYWRQGLGRRLMTQAVLELRAMRHKSLCLWVLVKNARANEFYRALGGQRIGKKQIDIGGKMLTDAAYGWKDTRLLAKHLAAEVEQS